MFTKLLNKLLLYFNFNCFNRNFPSFPFSNLVFFLCCCFFGRMKKLMQQTKAEYVQRHENVSDGEKYCRQLCSLTSQF